MPLAVAIEPKGDRHDRFVDADRRWDDATQSVLTGEELRVAVPAVLGRHP